MNDDREMCPTCGGPVLQVMYGMPGPDMHEAAERGEVLLGGCVLPAPGEPSHRCACGATKRVQLSSGLALPWDDDGLRVAGDRARTAKYRLLQSWYRETVLDARPGTYTPRGQAERPCGSLLHPEDVKERPDLNFLDPKVTAYAAERAAQVQEANGTIEEGRLRHNMLSSMPLCFNLFGIVRETPDAQLPFVRALFDPSAEAVEVIECEWTPQDDASRINDRTAFDAAIITRRPDGSRHLIGIETKYTEPFSQTRYGSPERRDAGKYRAIHDSSGWFDPDAHDRLTGSATNQLWRNCLLAATAERSGEVNSASIAVVALADDGGASKAVAGVHAAMTDRLRCAFVPLTTVISTSLGLPSLSSWAHEFDRRYVDPSPITARAHPADLRQT